MTHEENVLGNYDKTKAIETNVTIIKFIDRENFSVLPVLVSKMKYVINL